MGSPRVFEIYRTGSSLILIWFQIPRPDGSLIWNVPKHAEPAVIKKRHSKNHAPLPPPPPPTLHNTCIKNRQAIIKTNNNPTSLLDCWDCWLGGGDDVLVAFQKLGNLHHTWFLFGCLCFWNCKLEGWAVLGNWSSFDVYCTGSRKWWAGGCQYPWAFVGKEKKSFFFHFFFLLGCYALS